MAIVSNLVRSFVMSTNRRLLEQYQVRLFIAARVFIFFVLLGSRLLLLWLLLLL